MNGATLPDYPYPYCRLSVPLFVHDPYPYCRRYATAAHSGSRCGSLGRQCSVSCVRAVAMRLTQQLGGQIGRVQTVQLERIVGTVLLFLMGGLPIEADRGVAPTQPQRPCGCASDRRGLLCWRAPRDCATRRCLILTRLGCWETSTSILYRRRRMLFLQCGFWEISTCGLPSGSLCRST